MRIRLNKFLRTMNSSAAQKDGIDKPIQKASECEQHDNGEKRERTEAPQTTEEKRKEEEFTVEKIPENRKEEIQHFVDVNFTKREPLISKCDCVNDVIELNSALSDECIDYNASAMVIHAASGEIAGICLTKVISRDDPVGFEDSQAKDGSEKGKKFIEVLKEIEKAYDIFGNNKNINKVVEVIIITTSSAYGGRGLTRLLGEKIEEFAAKLECDALTAQCTGPGSQAAFRKLGYSCVEKVYYKNLFFDGKSLAAQPKEDQEKNEEQKEAPAEPYIGIFLKKLREE